MTTVELEAALGELPHGITASVEVKPRRKKLGAVVQPGGRHVTYAVPAGTTAADLEAYARRSRGAVIKAALRLQEIDCYVSTKDLVAGEGFGLMGRPHRLRIVDTASVPVEAVAAPTWSHRSWWLQVRRADLSARTIIEWYRAQGQAWLDQHVPALASRAGVPIGPDGLSWEVRPYRAGDTGSWASCQAASMMRVHWMVFQLPREWVEHIVKHELAHAQTVGAGHGLRWKRAMDRLCGFEWPNLEQDVRTGRKQILWEGATTPDAVQVAERDVVRHFQHFTSEQRADRAASHRLGHRQRQAVGETFFSHPAVPGRAFTTRRQAAQAAVRATTTQPVEPEPDLWGALAASLDGAA